MTIFLKGCHFFFDFDMIIEGGYMKKDVTMKKTSFIKGAFITTLGIVLAKIMGILYVIPFYSIIGEKGGALYGYAYTIYLVFMSLSSAGIPLAISKLVSEYQTLGYYGAKKKVFSIGKKLSLALGGFFFIIIVLFAPLLAKAVMGDIVGGNSLEDITLVIRAIGTAILIVPLLSIYRGYFEGHRFMSPPSISQVIEQLVRVTIIIFGSFIALKIFHISLSLAVSIALLGATVGAIISYLYLFIKHNKNKQKFNEKARPVNEPKITEKEILRKIVIYSIPFILIDIFKSFYNYVDMVTVVKGLVRYAAFSVSDAETIYSMLSTWGQKFNMILLSVSTGVIVSLIPNLTESIVKKDTDNVNKKITQALSMLLFLTIPMTLGISFLAKPIWMLFYGDSFYGPSVLSFYIFTGLFGGLFTAMITVLQTLKDYKSVFYGLLVGCLVKIILNYSLMSGFHKIGIPAYHGVILASILGYLTSFIYCLVILNKKYDYNFETLVHNLFEILSGSILMVIGLVIFKWLIPIYSINRLMNILIILAYMIIGMIIYFIYAYKSRIIERVFGKGLLNSIKKIILKKA